MVNKDADMVSKANRVPKANVDNPIFGLEKVPDKMIIKQLRVELGQANTFIQEQAVTIVDLKSQLHSVSQISEPDVFYDVDKLVGVPNDVRYNKLKLNMGNQIKELEKKCKKLEERYLKS